MKHPTPWTRLAAEGIVIVLSILLAFGIEAWWQGRGERALEDAAVGGIQSDFEASSVDIVRLMGVVAIADEVRFQRGALGSLAAGPGLSVIRDPVLRALLTQWSQEIEELAAINTFVTLEARRYLDLVAGHYSLQDIDRAAGEIDLPPSGFDTDTDRILSDIGFANVLYQQYFASRSMIRTLVRLGTIAEDVLSQVVMAR